MLSVQVIGVGTTLRDLGEKSEKMHAALVQAVDRLGAGFIDYLRANKLSGSPLHRITGALQQSFHHTTTSTDQTISSTVSSDSPYAAYHEYGYHGTEFVRAHTRSGHPVRAHERHIDYAGRPYFHPAIEEYRPIVYEEIDRAVAEALQ